MKVLCGFQDGADIAGARAAKVAGLEIGGWMPKNFRTESGRHPEYAEMYGARQTTRTGYRERTRLNAQSADTTVWFGNPRSSGAKLTFEFHRGRWFTVEGPESKWRPKAMADWLFDCQVLNVAGNRESRNPGISVWVEAYLTEVFHILASHTTSRR